MADTDRTETLTEQEADKLFDAVMSFTPDLGQADVESIESAMSGRGHIAVMRRFGLFLASKDGTWFQSLTTDREAAMCAAAQLEDLRQCVAAMRQIADVIEGAVVRTDIALCYWEDQAQLKMDAKAFALLQEAA